MDILLDNPLASMDGTLFLIFYVGFVGIILLLFGLIKTQIDKTDRLALPPIPPNIDPYEIAYLRGGTNEVARSVVFSLMQKGVLEFKTMGDTTLIKRTANQSPRLNQIEQIALDWLKNSRDSKDIFQPNGLVTQLEAYGEAFKARLAQQQMLVGDDLENKLSRWKWLTILAIAGLGGYKTLAAFSHGRLNVFGIIIVGVVGLVIALLVSKLPRLTKLGTAYLERLQLAFDSLKNQTQRAFMPSDAPKVVPSATFAGVDPLLLSVGVFGAGILAGTIYSEYNNAFSRANQQQAAASSSSCSAGCGSGCSSGSSDSSGSSGSSGSSCSSGCGGGCGGCS